MTTKAIAPSRLRNIGIIAHIDAGKTTTTERFLYYAGVSHQIGEIDEGTTQMDWMEEEKERGITITSAATRLSWNDYEINLIDTPGHVDFTAEVERALRVLDGAVVVLCGVGGVEPQSEMVWHQASTYKVPRIIFVNKMDRLGANFEAVLEDVRQTLGANPVVTHFPVGTEADFRGVVDVVRGVYLEWDDASKGAEVHEGPIPAEEQERYEQYRHDLLETVAGEDEELLAKFVEGQDDRTGGHPAGAAPRYLGTVHLSRALGCVVAQSRHPAAARCRGRLLARAERSRASNRHRHGDAGDGHPRSQETPSHFWVSSSRPTPSATADGPATSGSTPASWPRAQRCASPG